MFRKVPPSLYTPALPYEIEAQLRQGIMPMAFTRRMRMINLISATTLMKIEDDLMSPFDVMDLHHILDQQISQDAIIAGMDSDELSYALKTGNLRPLWDIAPDNPQLLKGFTSGWITKFINEPFDPLCVMLAMRARLMLDVIDELGHSYNLLRKIGYGFIDFGDIPGEEPGDPGDYYPPEIDNPIEYPEIPVPPTPEPGEPGYVEPMPGDPGYIPPGPGEPGYVPGPGEEGYTEPGTTPNTHIGGGPGGGAPWGSGGGAGDLGGSVTGGGSVTPGGGDPCTDKDDPEETVTIGYTTQGMAVDETQEISVVGNHARWAASNYTWKISGGGGSAYATDGDPEDTIVGPTEEGYDEDAHVEAFGVTYTAPAANAYCLNNPTIELWCGGNLMASLTIAVNAMTGTVNAFRTWGEARNICTPDPNCPGPYCKCESPICLIEDCYVTHSTYDCMGNLVAGPTEIGAQESWCVADGYCASHHVFSGTPGEDRTINEMLAQSPDDLRYPAWIEAGCCPEGLL